MMDNDPIKNLERDSFFNEKFGALGLMIVAGDDAGAIESILQADQDSLDIRRPLNPAIRLNALHLAARFNRVNIATILLNHARKNEYQDYVNCNEGFLGIGTPLHVAAAFGSVDVLRVLLNHGANVDAIRRRHRSFSGADCIVGRRTALALALHKGHLHIAQELRARGAAEGDALAR